MTAALTDTEVARLRGLLDALDGAPAVDWEARAKAALDSHAKWHGPLCLDESTTGCRMAKILRGKS